MTSKLQVVPHVDGVIGLVSQTPAKSYSKQKLVSNVVPNSSSQNPPGTGKTSKVHAILSTTADKSSKGKKEGKGKGKANAPKQGPPKFSTGESSQWTPKYPYLICEEDHYSKDCP